MTIACFLSFGDDARVDLPSDVEQVRFDPRLKRFKAGLSISIGWRVAGSFAISRILVPEQDGMPT